MPEFVKGVVAQPHDVEQLQSNAARYGPESSTAQPMAQAMRGAATSWALWPSDYVQQLAPPNIDDASSGKSVQPALLGRVHVEQQGDFGQMLVEVSSVGFTVLNAEHLNVAQSHQQLTNTRRVNLGHSDG